MRDEAPPFDLREQTKLAVGSGPQGRRPRVRPGRSCLTGLPEVQTGRFPHLVVHGALAPAQRVGLPPPAILSPSGQRDAVCLGSRHSPRLAAFNTLTNIATRKPMFPTHSRHPRTPRRPLAQGVEPNRKQNVFQVG